MFECRGVASIFCSSFSLSTTLKAFKRSTESMPVRTAGFRSLKPLAMAVARGRRAVTAHLPERKPCCDRLRVKAVKRYGRRRPSFTFTAGHNSQPDNGVCLYNASATYVAVT